MSRSTPVPNSTFSTGTALILKIKTTHGKVCEVSTDAFEQHKEKSVRLYCVGAEADISEHGQMKAIPTLCQHKFPENVSFWPLSGIKLTT